MSRAVILVLMLASLGLAAQASREPMLLASQVRKLSSFGTCYPPTCNPYDYPCVIWDNPCPTLLPHLPAQMECGTCVDDDFNIVVKDPCPVTACASTYATAVSQNGGCARASSTALASSGGQTVWDQAVVTAKSYVEGFLSGQMEMKASAYGFSMAMGRACSYAIAKYFQSACFCCNKVEFFAGGATANATAVAMAVAESAAKAFATVNATYPTFYKEVVQYIGAGSEANAFAADIKQVIAAVTAKFTGTPDGIEYDALGFPSTWYTNRGTSKCWSIKYTDSEDAVAKAMTCTVVSAFAKIYLDPEYQKLPGTAETWASACSGSIAIAGFASGPDAAAFQTCDIDCPCGVNVEDFYDPTSLEGVCKADEVCVNVTANTFGCQCKPDYTMCGADGCVNVKKDEENCGTCGNECGDYQYCSTGQCKCYLGTTCGKSCVNTDTDKKNCGSCGNECSSGFTCSFGSCKCLSNSACPTNFKCSFGTCKCGTTSNSCPSNQSCKYGTGSQATVLACRPN